MAKKENRGGELTNEQVERDNEIKGKTDQNEGGYRGLQDTGDTTVRGLGTDVQQNEGMPDEDRDRS